MLFVARNLNSGKRTTPIASHRYRRRFATRSPGAIFVLSVHLKNYVASLDAEA